MNRQLFEAVRDLTGKVIRGDIRFALRRLPQRVEAGPVDLGGSSTLIPLSAARLPIGRPLLTTKGSFLGPPA